MKLSLLLIAVSYLLVGFAESKNSVNLDIKLNINGQIISEPLVKAKYGQKKTLFQWGNKKGEGTSVEFIPEQMEND